MFAAPIGLQSWQKKISPKAEVALKVATIRDSTTRTQFFLTYLQRFQRAQVGHYFLEYSRCITTFVALTEFVFKH